MTPRIEEGYGLEPGEYSTRADPETGAALLSGRCASCAGVVKEGEPSGVYWLSDAMPIDPALKLPVGLFHRMLCAPSGDPRYYEESF